MGILSNKMEQQKYQVIHGGDDGEGDPIGGGYTAGWGDRFIVDMAGYSTEPTDSGECLLDKPWHYEIMRGTKNLFKVYPNNYFDYHGHNWNDKNGKDRGYGGCVKRPLPLRKLVYLGDIYTIGIVHWKQELKEGEVDFYDMLNEQDSYHEDRWDWDQYDGDLPSSE
jgi:hypothetical protein